MELLSNNEHVFSVSEYVEFLNEYLKPVEGIIQGEIGEKMNKYPFGIYFSLVDSQDKTSLQCFINVSVLRSFGVELTPGIEVRIVGRAVVDKKYGSLKVNVLHIVPVGEGALRQQFQILFQKLQAEGYFDAERKKKIPRFVTNIGLITSKVGRGAKKDFETNLGKFGFKIIFFPSKVEGAFAVRELVSGIEFLNREYPMLHVIVIARGGGSWESLQAFNSEELVKAIAASNIPIVCAVGHEDDVTLADYASDVRASTPTHAAKLLSEPWAHAQESITHFQNFLNTRMKTQIQHAREMFVRFEHTIPIKIRTHIRSTFDLFTRPLAYASGKMQGMRTHIDHFYSIFTLRITDRILRTRMQLISYEKTMALASPQLKLKQGYSIARNKEGIIIKSVEKIKKGDTIHVEFAKGSIDTSVVELHND